MAEATAPTSPTFVDNPRKTNILPDALGGTEITVGSNPGDLQAKLVRSDANNTFALTAAGVHRNNTYLVPRGIDYSALTFPLSSDPTGWTCIRPLGGTLPAVGTRVNDTTHPAQMWKVRSAGLVLGNRAITIPHNGTQGGWRIIGADVSHPNALFYSGLAHISGNRVGVERSYFHIHPDATQMYTAIAADDTAWFQLYDSLISTWAMDAESQAIYFKHNEITHIENNLLIGAAENVMLGDQFAGLPCRDSVFLRNHFFKPMRWSKFLIDGVTLNNTGPDQWDGMVDAQGQPMPVKNNFEIKWAHRVLVEGNTMENCWPAGQDGIGLSVKSGVSATVAQETRDVMMRSNLILNTHHGITISFGTGGATQSIGTTMLRFALLNNLFLACHGRWANMSWGARDLWIEHNTVVPMASSEANEEANLMQYTSPANFPRLTIRRNIIGHAVDGLEQFLLAGSAGDWSDTWAGTEGGGGALPNRDFKENAWYGNAHDNPADKPAIAGFTKFALAVNAGINLTTGLLETNSPLKSGGLNGSTTGRDIGVLFNTPTDWAAVPSGLTAALAGTPPLPSSTFSHVQTPATLTVVFTNTSSGAPFTAHLWTILASNGTTVLNSPLGTTENYSFTFPSSGSYFVRHRVTNAAQGQGDSGNVALAVGPIEADPPTITITGPNGTGASTTGSPTIILSGTATDATSVGWSNTTTGVGGPAGGTPSSWNTPAITLVEGDNVVVVTVAGPTAPNAQDTHTVTYTPLPPATPAPPQLMRGFGPTRGAGATDRIVIPLTAQAAQRTYAVWLRQESVGGGGFGRLLDAPATTDISHPDADRMSFSRLFTTRRGIWPFPMPPLEVRVFLVIKYDSGDVANVPTIKVDLVTQVLSTPTTPLGTPVNTAGAFTIGNRLNPADRYFDGDLGKLAIYNFLTTDQQDLDLYEGADPLTIGAGPVAYHPFDGVSATEADSVTTTSSTVTGTVVQDYGAPAPPPTVSLAVTEGNPATGVPYQITATTTGTVDRVEFYLDTVPPTGLVLTETRTTPPYLFFDAATDLLGPGGHTIEARVFDTPGGTADDTATLTVTEPVTDTGTGAWLVDATLCARIPTALSYNVYLDGAFHKNVPQPATGDLRTTVPFTGADTQRTIGVAGVFAGDVEGPRATVTPPRYTDPSATAVEGLKEVSRAYDGTTWTPVFVWEPKPLAIFYRLWLDGTLDTPIPIPTTGKPSHGVSFTGTDVEKTIWVAAVYAGDVEGPRAGMNRRYVAPVTSAPVGFQEHSRTFTP